MRVCSSCGRCFEDAVDFCVELSHPPLSEPLGRGVETIEGYRLEQIIRSGRTGVVYRAQHLDSGRPCLIRTVRTDESGGKQLITEANLASGTYLPGMVDLYEAGQVETGEYFIVCEDAEGQTVRDLLNAVGVPQLLTTIQIVRQAAEALHAVHLKGLIHGAVRPENIILSRDAEHRLLVRIQGLDLGGVEHRSIIGNKFLIDQAVNSITYFSPEQCNGEAISPRSDIYSLGIVLYELLAGVPPFEASTAAALIEMHRSKRPADVKIDDFDLRMLLTHTLMESLTKHPDRRQSSANAFARQMRHIEQLATHVSTPPPVVSAPVSPNANSGVSQHGPVVPAIASERSETTTTYSESFQIREVAGVVKEEPADEIYTAEAAVAEPHANFQVSEPFDTVAAQHDQPNPVSSVTTNFEQGRDTAAQRPASRLRLRRRKLHSLITETAATGDFSGAGIDQATAMKELVPVQHDHIAPVGEQHSNEENLNQLAAKGRHRVAWEQPEDDIPSMADVMDVLSRERAGKPVTVYVNQPPVSDVEPIIQSQPRPMPDSAKSAVTKAVTIKQPVDSKSAKPSANRLRQAAKPAGVAKKGPRQPQRASSYYPTLLGRHDGTEESRGAAEPIFSAYGSEIASGMRRTVRPILIGASVLAIASLLLFGNGPIDRYFATGPNRDAVSAKSEPTGRPATQESAPSPAPVTVKSEEPVLELKTSEVKERRVTVRENAPPAREPRKESNSERKTRPTSTSVVRDTVPRTTIGTRPKSNAAKNDSETRMKAPANKAAGTTRPRIVQETKQ